MLTAALGLAALARPLPVGRRCGVRRRRRRAGLLAVRGPARRAREPARGRAAAAGVRRRSSRRCGGASARRPRSASWPSWPSRRRAAVPGGRAAAGADRARAHDRRRRGRGRGRRPASSRRSGRTDEAVGLVVLGLATTAELFALVLAAARRGRRGGRGRRGRRQRGVQRDHDARRRRGRRAAGRSTGLLRARPSRRPRCRWSSRVLGRSGSLGRPAGRRARRGVRRCSPSSCSAGCSAGTRAVRVPTAARHLIPATAGGPVRSTDCIAHRRVP